MNKWVKIGYAQGDSNATEFYLGNLYIQGRCTEAGTVLARMKEMLESGRYSAKNYAIFASHMAQFCGVNGREAGAR